MRQSCPATTLILFLSHPVSRLKAQCLAMYGDEIQAIKILDHFGGLLDLKYLFYSEVQLCPPTCVHIRGEKTDSRMIEDLVNL